jgi:dolichol-phosphate mannosyltransferase
MRDARRGEGASILLPTLNEAGNIGPLIRRIRGLLPEAEILVLDDRSSDTTPEEAGIALGRSPGEVIVRSPPHGLTRSFREGIRRARGEVVCWLDADGSMPAELLPCLIGSLSTCDIAVGSRYVPGGKDQGHSLPTRFFSVLICLLSFFLVNRSVRDATSGFVAARRSVVESIPLRGEHGEYCIDLLCRARRKGFRIREIPYVCLPRGSGRSKTAASLSQYAKHGALYLTCIIRLLLEKDPGLPPSRG